jgi:pimeloyl-ACP methyl ester carboxylesterase
VDECWIDFDGKRLFVRSWGDAGAKPVFYWHGVFIAGRASMAINEAGEIFAREHGLRVLALDAPGFGSSPPLEPDAYHPHALADLVPPLLDALGIDRAPFVGFSWGGDIGCHVAARHADRLTALVLLDAGYSDPPFDPSKRLEEFVAENETDWEEEIEPSWELLFSRVRPRFSRWNAAIEGSVRAGRLEQGGRIVPSGDPLVVAAVQRGIVQALPSTTRAAVAECGLPVLLVASDDAAEEDLTRFAAEVPQAEIYRPGGVGHDVLVDGGPRVIAFVAAWLRANA